MVLLPLGLNTPSLRLEGSSTTPHQMDFNIERDIPRDGRAAGGVKVGHF
jgi:hypothetical protein